MIVKKTDLFESKGCNGTVYRFLSDNYSDFTCECTDEFDEEKGEYINFKRCCLSRAEARILTGAKVIEIEE